MKNNCKVIDLFNTSTGSIAILKFSKNNIPKMGMVLHDDENKQWKIVGIGMEKTNILSNKIDENNESTLWDCRLEGLGLDNVLGVGMTLYFNMDQTLVSL